MNYAVILSGGVGSRMRQDGFPKQYIEIYGKPILIYTLERFNNNALVDKIIIVAAEQWREKIFKINNYICNSFFIYSITDFAPFG